MTTRANITPPFQINTSDPIQLNTADYDPIANDEFQDLLLQNEVFSCPSSPEHSIPEAKPTKSTSVFGSNKIRSISSIKRPEKRKYLHKVEKGSDSAIADAMKMQAEVSSQHYKSLDECKKLELDGISRKLDIEGERLKYEKERDERASSLEERKAEQLFELEKMRMVREKEKEENELKKLQLQIELEKMN